MIRHTPGLPAPVFPIGKKTLVIATKAR